MPQPDQQSKTMREIPLKTIPQMEAEIESLKKENTELKAKATTPQGCAAKQTLAEEYQSLVEEGKTQEAAEFLAKNGNAIVAEVCHLNVPARDKSMSAREQFATLTNEADRAAFWTEYHHEILENL
jgi:hypothetical protein